MLLLLPVHSFPLLRCVPRIMYSSLLLFVQARQLRQVAELRLEVGRLC